MRQSLFAGFLLLSFLAAACSSSGSSDDATGSPTPSPSGSLTPTPTSTATPAGAYSCIGAALPTVAANPIVIDGTVSTDTGSGTTNLASAAVAGYRTGNGTALSSGTSNGSGMYSLSVPTGGTPVDGYLKATDSGYLDTYVYPDEPATADGTIDISMLTSTTFGFLQGFASVTQSSSKGVIIIEVVDCNDTPVAGATVTSSPAGTVRYLAGGVPSSSASATDADGVAFIFNVGPGDVSVMASAGGHTLRAHTVNAPANSAITTTQIAPGSH